jgi:hypothetical protein
VARDGWPAEVEPGRDGWVRQSLSDELRYLQLAVRQRSGRPWPSRPLNAETAQHPLSPSDSGHGTELFEKGCGTRRRIRVTKQFPLPGAD